MPDLTRQYRVRAADVADTDALVAARVQLFRELGRGPDEGDGVAFAEACREVIRSGLECGNLRAWLAVDDLGRVVGTLVLLLFPRLPTPGFAATSEGYIVNVWVEPRWRRLGVASALSATAKATATDLQLARIRLHTTAAGRSVYVGVGFRPREDELELVLPTATVGLQA